MIRRDLSILNIKRKLGKKGNDLVTETILSLNVVILNHQIAPCVSEQQTITFMLVTMLNDYIYASNYTSINVIVDTSGSPP